MKFQILKFDTELFGFKVAKIVPTKLSLTTLRLLLKKLQNENVRLVYWQSDSADKKSQIAARKLKGSLCSKQVTYLIDLKKISPPPKTASKIKSYRAKTPSIEMKQLAVQIGALSRFGTDPKLPKKLFHKIYHAWIKNSVNKTVADKVLVIKNKTKVAGMITLGSKNKRGDIGLVAVAKTCRGKKFGTKLVHSAQNYFIKQGYFEAQVVTQKANTPACRLYKKCGFHLEKTENFYHFWL